MNAFNDEAINPVTSFNNGGGVIDEEDVDYIESIQTVSGKNEMRICIAFMPHFAVFCAGISIKIACNNSIPANYICEEDLVKTMSPYEIFFSIESISFNRSFTERNTSTVQEPAATCVYPWLAGDTACITLMQVAKPSDMTTSWMDLQCASINGSVYHNTLRMEQYDYKIAFIDTRATFTALLEHIDSPHKTISMMEAGSRRCIVFILNGHFLGIDNCSSPTFPLPEVFHVACIRQAHPQLADVNNISIDIFHCKDGNLIPSAFQCDGTAQCLSGDDEALCDEDKTSPTDCSPLSLSSHRHQLCSSWCPALFVPCSNGKCIPLDAVCNGHVDCADSWDEHICAKFPGEVSFKSHMHEKPHSVVKTSKHMMRCYDGSYFSVDDFCIFDITKSGTIKGCQDSSHLVNCQHVGCPHAYKCKSYFCIPLRRVCDGVIDCLHGDDEIACDDIVCIGLFQRRESNVCIPPWELCDGQVHCLPYQEDEIYCDACPSGLLCHGLAAECKSDAVTHELPAFLKAFVFTHSTHVHYIISLNMEAPTLLYLDVPGSQIGSNGMKIILQKMPQLVFMNVANNAIEKIKVSKTKSCLQLKVLNLSFNNITALLSYGMRSFINLLVLILYNNRISVIQSNSLVGLESLKAMDLRENDIMQILDIPRQSPLLYHVESDLFNLCCLLSSVEICTPASSAFSTCKNLLHVKFHRVLIYGQAVLTLLMNSLVLALQKCVQKKERNQIIQLTVGNLLMSCYLMLIAVVDTFYRNHFRLIAVSWNKSFLCKMAASLNLVGAEVSLSLLIYISIFRAYSIQSLYKSFSARTTWTVCMLIWVGWLSYAMALSTFMSIYNITIDSDICIYLFFQSLSNSITIKIHSILFVTGNLLLVILLFVFSASIAWRVFHGSELLPNSKLAHKRKRSLTVRLCAIVLFCVVCWLPLLLCQLFSLLGISLPTAVPVWMAILFIPINASFCPLMFALIPIISKK